MHFSRSAFLCRAHRRPVYLQVVSFLWEKQHESFDGLDFTRFRRHISTSSSKLLECQRAQLV
jgi:hypothetical protein